MKWGNITCEHHRRKVSVSAKSTPESPLHGAGPYVGYVLCRDSGTLPILTNDYELRTFASWYDVEFIDE